MSEEVPKKETFVTGHTWGSYNLSEDKMRFIGQSKKWFDIPLNALSNVQQGGNKNEIALEFNKDDEVEDSAICEIKLFIPQKENKKDENPEEKEEDSKNQEEEEKVIKTKGELLKEEIMKIAGIGSVSGAIAQIPDIQFMIPRGKFDMFFLKNSLKMNGQSHSYQVQSKNITKIFLLPKAEGNGNLLILKLKSPITQGNISYPFLIIQLKEENEISIDLQIPEDDEDLNNIDDFQSPLKGKSVDVLSKLFYHIFEKRFIYPPSDLNFTKGPFIKCSYKANNGVLYFLERTIVFAHKPVLDIEHDSIKEVDLARIQVSNMQQRSFDITIKLKKKEEYQFSGLDREEIDILKQYMEAKKIKFNAKDEDNNDITMPAYTSTRRRVQVSDELPNLPSEDEMGDEDFNDSGEDNDDYDDGEDDDEGEEDEEEEKEKKKKDKNKKKKEE
jgi:structure-specific recognition protein 1